MNFRFVFRQLGLVFIILSSGLVCVAGWSALQLARGHHGEGRPLEAFAISAVAGLTAGALLWALSRPRTWLFGRREALLLVAMSWLIGAALAALPFFVWAHLAADAFRDHSFQAPINCYFEAMSGLTTTGATVLTNISAMPRSMLLWRASTHLPGGLGIVVLFVAVLPSVGVGGKKLFRVEAPGPEPEGVHPHIRETARILWLIYLGLTVMEILGLRLAGMDWFDSVCHTFAPLATGGFSTIDHSIGGHDPLAVNIIVILFMVLAGVNFGLYFQLIRGQFRGVWRDSELRAYLAILFVASVIIVLCVAGQPIVLTTGEHQPPAITTAIRHGVFTTVSLQTTTGFCTADFNRWPFAAKALLVVLMFVGASAGSTGGGIKVIRILIAFKVFVSELERVFRPNVVRPVKVGRATVTSEMRLAVIAYVLGIILLFGAGTGLLKVLEPPGTIDMTTAASASAATLCNIGPGLAKVGAVETYAWFTAQSKFVMALLMALGRLEVFAILVLFVPRFWRNA